MTAPRPTPMTTRNVQAGFSLLEVLIAVIVLSLGLLGLAGLQTSALRNNQSAMERSMAVIESYSIIDAMRIDPDAVENGLFNLEIDADPEAGTFSGNELVKWRNRLQDSLGADAVGAVGCVGSLCTITVQWNDQRGTAGSTTQQIVTEARI